MRGYRGRTQGKWNLDIMWTWGSKSNPSFHLQKPNRTFLFADALAFPSLCCVVAIVCRIRPSPSYAWQLTIAIFGVSTINFIKRTHGSHDGNLYSAYRRTSIISNLSLQFCSDGEILSVFVSFAACIPFAAAASGWRDMLLLFVLNETTGSLTTRKEEKKNQSIDYVNRLSIYIFDYPKALVSTSKGPFSITARDIIQTILRHCWIENKL